MGAANIHARAWAGMVNLLRAGNVSELNVASLSRTAAVLEADAIIRAVAESEWMDAYEHCKYCGEFFGGERHANHAPTCVWQRARDFVDKETK